MSRRVDGYPFDFLSYTISLATHGRRIYPRRKNTSETYETLAAFEEARWARAGRAADSHRLPRLIDGGGRCCYRFCAFNPIFSPQFLLFYASPLRQVNTFACVHGTRTPRKMYINFSRRFLFCTYYQIFEPEASELRCIMPPLPPSRRAYPGWLSISRFSIFFSFSNKTIFERHHF